jgi:hypothetical protein
LFRASSALGVAPFRAFPSRGAVHLSVPDALLLLPLQTLTAFLQELMSLESSPTLGQLSRMACPSRIRTTRIPVATDRWETYLSSMTPNLPKGARDRGSLCPNEHVGPYCLRCPLDHPAFGFCVTDGCSGRRPLHPLRCGGWSPLRPKDAQDPDRCTC